MSALASLSGNRQVVLNDTNGSISAADSKDSCAILRIRQNVLSSTREIRQQVRIPTAPALAAREHASLRIALETIGAKPAGVTPGLLDALREDPDEQIRQEVASLLGRMGALSLDRW